MTDNSVSPRESIFDFEEHDLLGKSPERVIDVDRILAIICRLQEQINQLDAAAREAAAFYGDRTRQAIERMTLYRENLENYLNTTGQSKLATPHGTIYFATSTERTWPDDEVLLAFAKGRLIPAGINEKPCRKAILQFIRKTGLKPAGFKEEDRTALAIRPRQPKEAARDVSTPLAA
jgi:hypothetical protein